MHEQMKLIISVSWLIINDSLQFGFKMLSNYCSRCNYIEFTGQTKYLGKLGSQTAFERPTATDLCVGAVRRKSCELIFLRGLWEFGKSKILEW